MKRVYFFWLLVLLTYRVELVGMDVSRVSARSATTVDRGLLVNPSYYERLHLDSGAHTFHENNLGIASIYRASDYVVKLLFQRNFQKMLVDKKYKKGSEV